eukprot:1156350-Pelagomonas_calceolata.AAC.3
MCAIPSPTTTRKHAGGCAQTLHSVIPCIHSTAYTPLHTLFCTVPPFLHSAIFRLLDLRLHQKKPACTWIADRGKGNAGPGSSAKHIAKAYTWRRAPCTWRTQKPGSNLPWVPASSLHFRPSCFSPLKQQGELA